MWKLTKTILVLSLALAGIWTCSGASRDSVRFTLTIEDREMPDMTAYRALSLCGKAFDYEKSRNGEDVLYRWFARALLVNDLPMVLTYRGYAQWLQMGGMKYRRHPIWRPGRQDLCLPSKPRSENGN